MKSFIRLTLLALSITTLLVTLQSITVNATPVATTTSSPAQMLMHSHDGDRPVASEAMAQEPSTPVSTEYVTYTTVDDTPITGYLARPEGASDDLPGLIVIHEWWGLNENIEAMTRRLAGEGYVALAVDLYAGESADAPEQALALVDKVVSNPTAALDNLNQAYAYLKAQGIDTMGSIGWCFGGSWSLNTALLLPTELDAAVIYYGGQLVLDSAALATLDMPILGIFGELDDTPPPETVRTFASTLHDLDKDAAIYLYEGADHAFANPSGTRYNRNAATHAWNVTINFLNDALK